MTQKKDILTMGYIIPKIESNELSLNSDYSLMDADLFVISPVSFQPSFWGWVDFSNSGGGCYNVEPSKVFEDRISHLKKELKDFLSLWKTVFIFLSKKRDFSLATGVTSSKTGRSYSTYTSNNYCFLPIDIGNIVSASGKKINFTWNSIFKDFYTKFGKQLKYENYLEKPNTPDIIFTWKDESKSLWAVYKVWMGNLVVLPYLDNDNRDFTGYNEDETEFWTEKGIKFSEMLISSLVLIDKELSRKTENTPPPEWLLDNTFWIKEVLDIQNKINKNILSIQKLKTKNNKLNEELIKENSIKNLLFEQGKLLEDSVIEALIVLWYKAENYDDWELELDQVILSPEGQRFIGECEGKENKDINITKFRQLLESLNADFARDDIEEKAYGILFGNPQRLLHPKNRTLDFTKKCIIGAEREKIALVRTADLFEIIKYLKENKNDDFKKICRDKIFNNLWWIVEFPKIPESN